MHLFAYGTLMFPEVWRAVVGREAEGEPARVHGFAVYRAPGDVYPVMVRAEADAVVRGMVYRELDEATIELLDEYEAGIYDRVPVEAVLDSGVNVECQCYLLPREYGRVSAGEPWDAAAFQRDELKRYLAKFR